MTKKQINALAKEIFKAVESDLRGRKGIGDEWDTCEEEIQQEIRETNEEKIADILDGGKS